MHNERLTRAVSEQDAMREEKRRETNRQFVNRSPHEIASDILSLLIEMGKPIPTMHVMYRCNLNSKQLNMFYKPLLLKAGMITVQPPRPMSKRLYWKVTPKGRDYVATFGRAKSMLKIEAE